MEKETFYEKLQKLEPTVKEYFDLKKIAETSESMYIKEKCDAFKPHFGESEGHDEKSLVSTLKIIRIIMAVAAIWGVICVIIGIANLSGMDIALGVGICVGVFFLYRYLNGKFKEKLCAAQERANAENAYQERIEKARTEHRAIVATVDAKHEEMKAKFEELGLSSLLFYLHSYQDFSEMLAYAKNHPKQTTASSYLKMASEESKKMRELLYKQKQYDYEETPGYADNDITYPYDLDEILQHDREERYRHDLEMQRREEEARHSAELRERQRAWDEKKKQEAQDRIEHRKKNWEEINERSRLEKELRHQCNTCSLSSKCYMRGSFPCPTYRPR